MKERPIPFSAPMIGPVLADLKTQTRRVIRIDDTPISEADYKALKNQRGIPSNAKNVRMLGYLKCDAPAGSATVSSRVHCPYGIAGDRLWVREAWRTVESLDEVRPIQLAERVPIRYEADGTVRGKLREPAGRYRHGRFMCRWMSRIDIEVMNVRVERLHDITEEDARAEGVDPLPFERRVYPSKHAATVTEWSHRAAFQLLWESINGAESWRTNPWTWVVEFRRVVDTAKGRAA